MAKKILRFDSRDHSRLYVPNLNDKITEEEAFLEEDLPGSTKKTGRKGISNEGPDSSDEEADDSDDDMFNSDDENNNLKEVKSNNSKEVESEKIRLKRGFVNGRDVVDDDDDDLVEALDVDAFEKSLGTEDAEETRLFEKSGVRFDDTINSDKEGEEEEEDDDDDDDNDESQPKIERFGLEDDLEEGQFDADLNFTRNMADENEHQDSWLLDVKKSDIKKAQKAERILSQKAKQEKMKLENSYIGDGELLRQLIEILEPAQTPIEALQELNSEKSRHNKSRNNNLTQLQEDITKENARKRSVLNITEACDQLLQRGYTDIYDTERELLMRQYRKKTGHDYEDPARVRKRSRSPSSSKWEPTKQLKKLNISEPNQQWEFKWEGNDEIHGPYSAIEMDAWAKSYFDSRVSVRPVGSTDFVLFNTIAYL